MTLLDTAQTCAQRLQLPSPASFFTSTDNNMILLRSMIDVCIDEIKIQYPWPQLEREYTFTLSTNTASYVLPDDFNRLQNETLWNRTQSMPLIGPLSASEWQGYKSGILTTAPLQRFRVKGWATNQFFIDPTPDSTLNGQTCVYEYLSDTARKPKTWVASTVWTGIRYCSYNGNIYDRGGTGVGTTGTSPPVHITSTPTSDGSITWTYSPYQYYFADDSDQVLLDQNMIIEGAVWRFKRERGLDYEGLKDAAEKNVEINMAKRAGSPTVSVRESAQGPIMLGTSNYPMGGFSE